MKKIIIEENAEMQEQELNKTNQFCNAVNKELQQFKTDTGYNPTMDEVKKIMVSKDPILLLDNLNSFLDKQLDQMKITSTLMRANQKAGQKTFVDNLFKKLNFLPYKSGYLHQLSMENGLLILSKENEVEIRDSFRNYITSEKAKQFWELHKAATQALNIFSVFVKENTTLSYVSIEDLSKEFFYMDFETRNVESESMDYEGCVQRRTMQDKTAIQPL
ncbi:MAG: hypothetical protein ABI237_11605 [Ginsengibacter sp.]